MIRDLKIQEDKEIKMDLRDKEMQQGRKLKEIINTAAR